MSMVASGSARPRCVEQAIVVKGEREELPSYTERAIQQNRQLLGDGFLQEALLSALDVMPGGLVVLGGACRVVAMNLCAENLLSRRDGLWLCRDGRLAAQRPEEYAELRQMIGRALDLQRAEEQSAEGIRNAMLVTRRARTPLQIFVSSLPRHRHLDGAGLAGVIIHDPEMLPAPPDRHLRTIYGLTAAEAGLAAALAEGASLKTYAAAKCVTLETARSRLKQVMAKMNVHRQSELVRAVLAIPPMAESVRGAIP